MTTIRKYQAEDGTEFYQEANCLKYEAFEAKVGPIIAQLKPIPEGCSFSNGSGYIRQSADVVLKVRRELLQLAQQSSKHEWLQQSIDDPLHTHPSYAGRIIGEMDSKALNSAWYRIQCIDSEFREWGQIYYANNPDKAEQTQLA